MTRSQSDFAGGFLGMNPIPVMKVKAPSTIQHMAQLTLVEQAETGGWLDEAPDLLSMLGIREVAQ
jgi:hypothetical protein